MRKGSGETHFWFGGIRWISSWGARRAREAPTRRRRPEASADRAADSASARRRCRGAQSGTAARSRASRRSWCRWTSQGCCRTSWAPSSGERRGRRSARRAAGEIPRDARRRYAHEAAVEANRNYCPSFLKRMYEIFAESKKPLESELAVVLKRLRSILMMISSWKM